MPAKRYLAIETSSPRLSLALGDDERLIQAMDGRLEWRHTEALFSSLKRMLSRARWPIQSLTGVAVSIGPGSFTGIRIGLAVARALGQSLKIPVVGVSSLELIAAGAATRAIFRSPRIDALRGNVFAGLYRKEPSGQVRVVVKDGMMEEHAWTALVKKHVGKAPCWMSPIQGSYPDARVLLALGRPLLAKADKRSYQKVLPLYIREAAAVERRPIQR